MVLVWVVFGGYFFVRMVFGKYEGNAVENEEDIKEEENIG